MDLDHFLVGVALTFTMAGILIAFAMGVELIRQHHHDCIKARRR